MVHHGRRDFPSTQALPNLLVLEHVGTIKQPVTLLLCFIYLCLRCSISAPARDTLSRDRLSN
jgi:hypothetical protein